jgi:hypothetical protein
MSHYPVAYSFPKNRWVDMGLFVFGRKLDNNLTTLMGNYLLAHCMSCGLLLVMLQPYLSQELLSLGVIIGGILALPMSFLFGVVIAFASVNVHEFPQEYIVSFK